MRVAEIRMSVMLRWGEDPPKGEESISPGQRPGKYYG